MTTGRTTVIGLLVLAATVSSPAPGSSGTASVEPATNLTVRVPRAPRTIRAAAEPGAAAAALGSAVRGDIVVLAPGVHRGPLRVTAAITLRGEPGTIVDGGGKGSVITVAADDAILENFAVRASGRDIMKVDAAVQVLTSARVRLHDLAVTDALYGIYAERANAMEIEGCSIIGRVAPLDESGTGNGIHLWYCSGVHLRGNQIEHFLDGIYLSFANDIMVTGNRLQWNGRYGLHTMYCQSNTLERNIFTLNMAGCALMFANGLTVDHNDFIHNRGPRTYGLLLRDCSGGTFSDNRLVDNTIAVFMDNSNRNRIEGNLLQDNGWGLLLFSSCAGNVVAGNAFINDDYPVALDMRRTSNQFDDGTRGNYWSDHAPYDLDDDGFGDVPYSPVGAFAFLSKQYPDLSVLANSPAVVALGVAERVVPALRPSEAVDHRPLLVPPAVRGTGLPLASSRGPGSGAAAAGFGALTLIGAGGMVRSLRAR